MSLNAAPRKKSKFPWVPVAWAVGAAVVLGGGGYMLFKPKAPKDPYRTEQVTRGDVTKSVSASGSLQALVTVQVGSQISGQITKVLVDFNSAVMSVEVALEEHAGMRVLISDAPLVEGAYMAAVEAAVGASLEDTAAAAMRAREIVKVHR